MTGFTTRAIHGSPGRPTPPHGVLRTPVYDSVAFEQESAQAMEDAFAGRRPAHVYSRMTNPTVQDFEQKLQALSGGIAVLAVSSGMAAIANTILTLGGSGKNIVTSRYLFGNTLSLFERTLAEWGLETRYVSMLDLDEIEAAVDHNTCAVFLESMTNPQLEVADCRKIKTITSAKSVPLILDNTLLTPCLFNSREAGVDIEILSTTKYISGGATCLGGVIIDNGSFDWSSSSRLRDRAKKFGRMALIAALRQEVHRNAGACLSPHNAYLQSLGLETLALRINKSCRNAMLIAKHLENHPGVVRVNYPGLASSPAHECSARQFSEFGGIMTFNLASREQCYKLMDSLKIIRRATNVNDNKTLIIHPASTIFAEYRESERELMGVSSDLLRLSVGIEDHEDLLDDLDKGLDSP